MTPIEEFHKAHGPAWARITSFSSFNAGLTFISIQHTREILALTDEEIAAKAVVILSEIRGRLRMEAELLALPTMEEQIPVQTLREEYVDSQEEAFTEQQRQLKLNQTPV